MRLSTLISGLLLTLGVSAEVAAGPPDQSQSLHLPPIARSDSRGTCGAVGYDKNRPGSYKTILGACIQAQCLRHCKQSSKCQSYAVDKDSCSLYSAPVHGNLKSGYGATRRFYDKSCPCPTKVTSTPTKSVTTSTTKTNTKSTSQSTSGATTTSSLIITSSSTTSPSTTIASTTTVSTTTASTTTASTTTASTTTSSLIPTATFAIRVTGTDGTDYGLVQRDFAFDAFRAPLQGGIDPLLVRLETPAGAETSTTFSQANIITLNSARFPDLVYFSLGVNANNRDIPNDLSQQNFK
ncbi:Putative PAN/Apple domain-containing protein [Septoria linicola]|uniref:PAN/Apple domain-containing protein n=1 Tax=Septoria linicola TaxID=215465 RepID=A0A9Q9ELA5_9PEZI|nr:Putative PAN/Apple domain-containing protein [Septoria linicola]